MPQLRSWEESGPPHFLSLEAVCHFLRDQSVCPHLCSRLSLSKVCIAPFVYKEVRSDLAKLQAQRVNLLLRESLFVVRVVDGFWDGDTLTQSAALTLINSTFVVYFLYPSTRHLLYSFVELLVHLGNDDDVFAHAVYFWLATLLLPHIATCLTQLVQTYNLFGSVRFLLLSNSSASPSLHCLYKLYSVRAYFSNRASSLCASSLEPAKTLQAIWNRFRISLSS